MHPVELRKKIEKLSSLPTIPRVAKIAAEIVSSPSVSLKQLERAIGSDPALTAKVLRYANSSFYGFPEKIAHLSHAMILLGMDMIRGLVLSSVVLNSETEEADKLCLHSLAVSRVAEILGARAGLKEVEKISELGLLHDLGKLAILYLFPKQFRAIGRLLGRKGINGLAAERAVLGMDHSEISGCLCQAWCFPKELLEPIAYHHSPEKAGETRREAATIHLADVIVKSAGLGYSYDIFVPPFKEAAWHYLGLTLDDLEEVIFEVADQLRNIELLDPFSR